MEGTTVLGRVTWRTAKIVAVHEETATALTLALAVRERPGHVAGQHVDVRLTAQDRYSAVRSYSIASAPSSDGRIQITVERLLNGKVSPYLTQEVMVGDELELRGPIGGSLDFRLASLQRFGLLRRLAAPACGASRFHRLARY
jgi:ferredoxin-NADP reductase